MFQVRRHQKWILWFLALAVLCFTASLIPAIRKRLLWNTEPSTEQPDTQQRD